MKDNGKKSASVMIRYNFGLYFESVNEINCMKLLIEAYVLSGNKIIIVTLMKILFL